MRNHTRQLKQWLLAVLLAALALLPQPAYASGIATDDLRIRVGYFGMSTDEYVDVDTYHWSQLESDLPLAQQAYSFLRVGEDGTYQVIVDSARGFYIDDLLEYANINISDIQSMNFYTRDQETGYFTSFSLAELLQSRRYYFDDLPAHLYPIYDEEGNFTGQYDDTEAWQYAVEVRPMLALEDNWVRYEVGTEHTGPDYSAMGTANRFRLLFGQTSPMESRTNQTAKYVYAVNVTLDGQPEVVREMQPLEGTVGSHKTTMTLSVGNLSILKNLQQLLKFDSSDGGVLRIDSWTVTPNSTYSDLVTVEISYTILKEGTASISGNMGGLALNAAASVEVPPEEPPQEEEPPEEEPGQETTGGENSGTAAAAEPSQSGGQPQMIRLSAEMGALLEQLGSNQGQQAEMPRNQADSAPTVEPEDNRAVLLYTGLGALAVCLCGAAAEAIYFKKERAR